MFAAHAQGRTRIALPNALELRISSFRCARMSRDSKRTLAWKALALHVFIGCKIPNPKLQVVISISFYIFISRGQSGNRFVS